MENRERFSHDTPDGCVIGLSALRHLLWLSLNVMTMLRLDSMKAEKPEKHRVMFSMTRSVKPPWQSFMLITCFYFSAKQQPKGEKTRGPHRSLPYCSPLACEMVLDHSRTRFSDVAVPQLLLSC